MRIKELYKWQLQRSLMPAFWVYSGIIFLVYAIMFTSFGIFMSDAGEISINSTIFFVFTMGIAGFIEQFKFAICNGISRKTIMVSSILSYSTLVLMITVIELAMEWLFRGAGYVFNLEGIKFLSFSNILFSNYNFSSAFVGELMGFITSLCVSLAIIFLGYFMGTLNQRMSKPVKLIVYIGTPVLLVVILPLLFQLFSPAAKEWFFELVSNIFKFVSASPARVSFTALGAAVVLCGFSFLCIRRAPLRTI